jgi:hypothetical protein
MQETEGDDGAVSGAAFAPEFRPPVAETSGFYAPLPWCSDRRNVWAAQVSWANFEEIRRLLPNFQDTLVKIRIADDFANDCGERPPYLALTLKAAEGFLAEARHGDWMVVAAEPSTLKMMDSARIMDEFTFGKTYRKMEALPRMEVFPSYGEGVA